MRRGCGAILDFRARGIVGGIVCLIIVHSFCKGGTTMKVTSYIFWYIFYHSNKRKSQERQRGFCDAETQAARLIHASVTARALWWAFSKLPRIVIVRSMGDFFSLGSRVLHEAINPAEFWHHTNLPPCPSHVSTSRSHGLSLNEPRSSRET